MEKRIHELPVHNLVNNTRSPQHRSAGEELVELTIAKMKEAGPKRTFADVAVDVCIEHPHLLGALAGRRLESEEPGGQYFTLDGDKVAGRVAVRKLKANGQIPGPPPLSEEDRSR